MRGMLRNGMTSSGVVTGTISSTTAQGVLPQYAGHAAASLSPAISTLKGPSTQDAQSEHKAGSVDNQHQQGNLTDVLEENQPPRSLPVRRSEGGPMTLRRRQNLAAYEK